MASKHISMFGVHAKLPLANARPYKMVRCGRHYEPQMGVCFLIIALNVRTQMSCE
jgi:hypothetical protein